MHQALLLRERGLIVVFHRLDHFRDLALDLRLGGLDGVAILHHVRMLVAELVRELRLLPLQLGELALLLLDELIRQNRRHRVEGRPVALNRLDLAVRRFLLDALGLGTGHGPVEIGQLLHDDVLALFKGQGIVLLAIALQRRFGALHLLALLAKALAQPVRRFPRRGVLELEALLDVHRRGCVGDGGRQLWVRRGVLDVDEAAVPDRRDRQVRQELVDRPRLDRRFTVGGRLRFRGAREQLRHVTDRARDERADAEPLCRLRLRLKLAPQVQLAERPARERPALQDAVLRLVVIAGGLVLLDDFLERHDVRVVDLDQQLRARLIDRRGGEGIDDGGHDDEEQRRHRQPSTLVDDAQVVAEVRFGDRQFLRGHGVGRSAGRAKHGIIG